MLTPNMILWGRDVYAVEITEGSDAEKLTRMAKRLENAKANAWKRWKREYVHSLLESHRLNRRREPYLKWEKLYSSLETKEPRRMETG